VLALTALSSSLLLPPPRTTSASGCRGGGGGGHGHPNTAHGRLLSCEPFATRDARAGAAEFLEPVIPKLAAPGRPFQ